MFVTDIIIRKQGYGEYEYGRKDPESPYVATIKVLGQHGKVELSLSPELSKRIMAVIADEVAEAGRVTAQMMVAEIVSGNALLTSEKEG